MISSPLSEMGFIRSCISAPARVRYSGREPRGPSARTINSRAMSVFVALETTALFMPTKSAISVDAAPGRIARAEMTRQSFVPRLNSRRSSNDSRQTRALDTRASKRGVKLTLSMTSLSGSMMVTSSVSARDTPATGPTPVRVVLWLGTVFISMRPLTRRPDSGPWPAGSIELAERAGHSPPSVRLRGERCCVYRCDGTGVLEGSNALDSLFPSETGLLHAAEWGAEVEAGGAVVVDPYVSADQLRGDAACRIGIRCPDGTAEPGPRVVRVGDSVVFGRERDNRVDGAELFLSYDTQHRIGVDHQGRADEVASGEVTGGKLPELAHLGTRVLGFLDDFVDKCLLHWRVQRPHGRVGIQAIAELHLLQAGRQTLDEFVEAGGVHVDALCVHADLPGRIEDRRVEAVEMGVIQDGIFEEDRGVIPAQLERQASE